MLKPEYRQSEGKLGVSAFARQVENAQAMGVDRIETNAYRLRGVIDPATGKERWSGYYVWPRYGYDGPIPASLKASPEWSTVPSPLRGAKKVSELMVTEEGRDWWKEHGEAIDVKFNLKRGSESMRTLDDYLQEKLPVAK